MNLLVQATSRAASRGQQSTVLVLSLGLAAAYADETEPNDLAAHARPAWTTPIVVTPPLGGEAGDPIRFDRAEPTSRLTREQFEELPSDRRLSDVMDRMPGVFFRGPVGVNRDIKLRGMEKEYARFEIDGIQLPGLGGERDFRINRLSPLAIDSLELIRNPGASFESDGIAGRISAISRPLPKHRQLEYEVHLGGVNSLDAETRQGRLGFSDRPSDAFAYRLFLDYSRLPRLKDKSKTTTGPDGAFKSLETEDENVVEKATNISGDFGWTFGESEFRLKPRFDQQDSSKDKIKTIDDPSGLAGQETEVGSGDDQTAGLTLEHTLRLPSQARLKSDLSYFATDESSFKSKQVFKRKANSLALDKTEEESGSLDDAFRQLRSSLSLPLDFPMAQDLSFGLQARWRERGQDKAKTEIKPDGSSKDKTEAGDSYRIDERLLAFYLESELYFSDQLSLKPGLRFENSRHESSLPGASSATADQSDLNPSLHLRYGLSGKSVFKAAVSRKLNRPKFEQLVPFQKEKGDRFEEGNPDLQPVDGWLFDLGWTYSSREALFSVLAFHKEVNGAIDIRNTGLQRDGKDIYRAVNIGNGWVQGLEFEQRLNLSAFGRAWEGVVLWANQGLYDSELTSADTGEKQPFSEQRDYLVNLGFDYRFLKKKALFTFAGKYIGDLEKVKGPNEVEIEKGRFLVDLGLRYQLSRSLTLSFDVINVLDPDQDKYLYKGSDTTFDTESPGRVYYLGLQAKY